MLVVNMGVDWGRGWTSLYVDMSHGIGLLKGVRHGITLPLILL